MHDRVYIFTHELFKASQSAFLYKGTILQFCLLIIALICITLNTHSVMITNTWDNLSFDKTVIVSYKEV